jgi:hypothetical protein
MLFTIPAKAAVKKTKPLPRDCERSAVIQKSFKMRFGLPRFARNDGTAVSRAEATKLFFSQARRRESMEVKELIIFLVNYKIF